MKLLGSKASPYVRRIRLQLIDTDHEFIPINIFDEADRKTVADLSPTLRIPILIDGETVIWDSLLITQYLSPNPLTFETQKDLVLINELSDAGIQLYQLRKFGTDTDDQSEFSKANLNRISLILEYFGKKNLSSWSLTEKWLYCTLDWFAFREVFPWRDSYSSLGSFYDSQSSRPDIIATDPRQP